MRLINRLLATLLVAVTTLMASCERPVPLPTDESIAVTYTSLDGSWQLTMWQGAELAEETYLYITFDRKEHRYTMWDNIDSMYATDTTGSFSISEEEDGTYTLTGTYDYGMGEWSYAYMVTLDEGGKRMVWKARGASEVMVFKRVEAIPELY